LSPGCLVPGRAFTVRKFDLLPPILTLRLAVPITKEVGAVTQIINGTTLKAVRLWRGITQQEVADEAGVSQPWISQHETHGWSFRDTWDVVAGLLDVPPSDYGVVGQRRPT